MRKKHIFRAALALVLSLSLSVPVHAATSAEIKEELNGLKDRSAEIQAEINGVKYQYDANASEIQSLIDKKTAIDQEIALLHEQLLNTNEQVRVYAQLIANSQDELENAGKRLDELNAVHTQRIRAMEEQGNLTYWDIIFESRNFTDLLDRMNMVDEIAEADMRRLEELKIAADIVEATQNDLASQRVGLEESQRILADTEAELTNKRSESDDLIRELVKKGDEFKALMAESQAAKDELMKEIAQKQRELQAAQYQEELVRLALKGQNPPSNAIWQIPVSGYTITSPFGQRNAPTAGASTNHQGVDMACPQGTPIYATRSGTVAAASYQAGGAGYYVSLTHGDGFGSIYMHMTNYVVSAGQTVSQGQLIGYVGMTGVATGPHLHFGVTYGGTYVNPMAYIG